MSEPEPGSRIRRADPTLHDRRSPDSLRPFGLPRAIGVLLYGVFSALLVIPLIRRLRRRLVWNFVRIGAALVAVALLFFGQSWAYVIAAVLAAGWAVRRASITAPWWWTRAVAYGIGSLAAFWVFERSTWLI